MRTDVVEDFQLDRGFHVLLTAYPAVRRWFKPRELELRAFQPGALVRIGNGFQPFHDISRLPAQTLGVLFSRVSSFSDKLKLRKLRLELLEGTWDAAFSLPEQTSRDFLRSRGFSDRVIQRFFRPFFGGVFLEKDLNTSSRMLRFTMRMFAEGAAALPAGGMQSVPEQLSRRLSRDAIHLGKKATSVFKGRVIFDGGGSLYARKIVIATDGNSASRLDGRVVPPNWRSTACFYYAVEGTLQNGGFLMLNGDGNGPINHAAILSEVAPEYAPPGKTLVCANVIGPVEISGSGLESAVRAQLGSWLKVPAERLRLLRSYDIPHALPYHEEGTQKMAQVAPVVGDEIYVCGDHCGLPAMQGAMDSGLRVAQKIVAEVKERSALDWMD